MHLAPLVPGRKHYLADQRAQCFGGATAVVMVGERLRGPLHPLAVEVGDAPVELGTLSHKVTTF